MREEVAEHLARSTARFEARGLAPDEARREALREFGNVPWLQEEARYARGTVWADALGADLRFALRHFARRPWTSAAMFVVLVIGMSLSTLLFTGMWSYAVEPPPGVAADDDLVRIRGSRLIGRDCCVTRTFSRDEFDGYRGLTDHFTEVAGWSGADVVLRVEGAAGERVLQARGVFVTPNYFSLLGLDAAFGRGLAGAEERPSSQLITVISHLTWLHLFERDPGVIGSSVLVNGVPVTVVGVAPESFRGLPDPGLLQLWLPLSTLDVVVADAPGSLRAIARLRPGVSRSTATAAVQVIAARAAESSDELRLLEPSAQVVPLLARNNYAGFEEETRYFSVAIGLLALLVLLIVCTNASTLLTGLATARRHEIAVRLSLGAARRRLIRQLLTESVLLAIIAGLAGLAVVWAVIRVMILMVTVLPFEVYVRWPAVLFTFAIGLSVGVLFGLAPALHATRLALAGVLQESITAKRARLQRALVVAQIALTQPLIVLLAALLLLVIGELQPRRSSDSPERVIATSVSLPSSGAEPMQRLDQSMRRVVERLKATPGIESAVLTGGGVAPLGSYSVHAEDRAQGTSFDAFQLTGDAVDPEYFAVMGLPLIHGRTFASADIVSSRLDVPIIVGDDLARLWGSANPVGLRLVPASDTAAMRTMVVVGVIDVAEPGRTNQVRDHRIYLPADPDRMASGLLIRTVGLAEPMMPAIRGLIQEEAPATVVSLLTFAQVEAADELRFRSLTGGLSVAGVVALLLSAIGLYAVVAFAVGQRTREIAIRIAVGGSRRQLVGHFIGDGLRLSAIGLVLGLPVSLLGLRVLTILLRFPWPIPLAPITAIATVGVILVATAAVWIPARAAAAVDPAVTLRRD